MERAKKEEKTRREWESWSWLCQATPLIADAGRSPAMALLLPLPVGSTKGCEGEQKGKGYVYRGAGRRGFVPVNGPDNRRIFDPR
jgi:hypothetical protein